MLVVVFAGIVVGGSGFIVSVGFVSRVANNLVVDFMFWLFIVDMNVKAAAMGAFSEAVPWRQHAPFSVVSCVVYTTSEGNREKKG